MLNVTYSNSAALSPTHYRLVTALETSKSSRATLSILLATLSKIQTRWNKGPISPSTARHDLILALYCRSQRPATPVNEDEERLLSLRWCLAEAVKLAGGGKDALLQDRIIGYRACDEIFTVDDTSELKLLLINTIRSDIYAPHHSSKAEARWAMGLRAAASPRLASTELIPAISERVLSLLQSCTSAPIRRLALAALQTLLALTPPSSSFLDLSREVVISLLTPPPPPPTEKRSRPTRLTGEHNPSVLSTLVVASATSPLAPILPEAPGATVRLWLGVLRRVTSGEWKDRKWEYHGIACGWLAQKVLRTLEREMRGGEKEEALQKEVAHSVLDFLETTLQKDHLAHGLLLESFSCLSHLDPSILTSLSEVHTKVFNTALALVSWHLQSDDLNLQLLALRILTILAPDLWASKSEKDNDGGAWGEKTWKKIMGGLQSCDGVVRKQTLRLLTRVDNNLAQLHFTRLFAALASLSAASNPSTPESTASRDRVLSLLMEASAAVDTEPKDWAKRLYEIIGAGQSRGGEDDEEVLQVVVMGAIDQFGTRGSDEQGLIAGELWEAGGWRKDLTSGLIVAATIGVGRTEREERERIALGIAEWLENKDGSTSTTLLESLLEPFALSLLRIVSHPSVSLLSLLPSLLPPLRRASSQLGSSLSTAPLFSLLFRCLEDNPTALLLTGSTNSTSTLPDFHSALQRNLTSPRPRPSRSDSNVSSASTSSSSDRPLRYQAYATPVSPSASTTRPVSAKSKEREAKRDRAARGGKGGIGESLLGAGALALIGVEQGLESESEDEDEEGSTPMQGSLKSDEVASKHIDEVVDSRASAADDDEHSRERAGSSSSGTDEAEQPPADLLIELESTNPFRDAS